MQRSRDPSVSTMTTIAFTQTHVYHKQAEPKDKDKHCFRCLELFDRHVYIGTKDSIVQHLTLASAAERDWTPGQDQVRECGMRKLGPNTPVLQLRAVPVFNHLLVLWDRRVSALNMFSLEPVPSLGAIRHTSSLEVCKSSLVARSQRDRVEMVTSSSRRKVVRIHVVWVDGWEIIREVSLPQDPVALAVDGTCLCVATGDRYLLCDYEAGSSTELFPHDHGRQNAMVCSVGKGEFLLNGPGSLGMFVMSTGICQRPPVQWPQGVLAAAVCPPYMLALQSQALSIYSLLDQRLKQTVSLNEATGLVATPDGALVFTDREIFRLSLVPLQDQIQALVGCQRLHDALSLLNGVQSLLQPDSYKEQHKAISRLAGLAQFNQETFTEAKDLFIEGEMDPREIISLYPDLKSCLGEGYRSQRVTQGQARDLQVLQQEDSFAFQQYLGFLSDYLQSVRGTDQCLECLEEVDSALLWTYAEKADHQSLRRLVGSPNSCRLDHCIPVLQRHNRYFILGLLYQSHGQQIEAIKTWMRITDGHHDDSSCPDVYEHLVSTLSTQDRDIVWMFAEWALQKNQEVGVQIFTKRRPDDRGYTFVTGDVLTLLEKYPLASLLYLEFLINELQSEKESHHTLLALTYITQTLEGLHQSRPDAWTTRKKLQDLLWDSTYYDVCAVHERIGQTPLYTEKAIVLGRMGEHSQALKVLVHEERDPQAAHGFCRRAAQGEEGLRRRLLLTLLGIYLSSGDLAGAAVDLLTHNSQFFPTETVIDLLPGSWSTRLVYRYLLGSLRESLHQRRMGALCRALAQAECLRHKVMWTRASKVMVRVDRGQACGACQKALTESFICTVRGELVHTSCFNTHSQ